MKECVLGQTSFIAGALIICSTLVGCGVSRDAASEPPVKMQAGRYEISYGGKIAGFGMSNKGGSGSAPKSACITGSTASSWPKSLIRDAMPSNGYCSFKDAKRIGNALSGKYVCEADRERAPGGTFTLS